MPTLTAREIKDGKQVTEKYIIKISRERWEMAQEWEREHWVKTQKMRAKYGKNIIWKFIALLGLKSKYRGDDWNYWWKRQFNDYNFLPEVIENAIELGCGPYTNFRLIIERCVPKHLFLSDPLIRTYVNFKQTFVSEMYRKGLCIIDDQTIEEFPFAPDYFDLCVMINVLDHVQDAELCMKNAINITKPGGILIIGQDLTDEEDMHRIEGAEGEVGHPIKIGHDWLDKFIKRKFESLIYKILPREEGRAPIAHYGTYIFAGKKLNYKKTKDSDGIKV